ncbi:hypothetical protein [Nocardioides daejeonensis]|uniref:hypothetical protein n=1 Tax=Nocardioides daejeonensis TaxID=1046556 RepID=UPI000D74C06F|nr:hypothetical protein [Nocardioides daejeonensis]
MAAEDAVDDRAATPEDVDAICRSLPHVTFGTSWGSAPTYFVSDPATKAKPKGFLIFRPARAADVDPATGEPYDDLLVLFAADQGAKAGVVESPGPFFTIPHFDGHDGFLVQQSRLGEVTVAELREVITDSWLRMAPSKLRRGFLEAEPKSDDE